MIHDFNFPYPAVPEQNSALKPVRTKIEGPIIDYNCSYYMIAREAFLHNFLFALSCIDGLTTFP